MITFFKVILLIILVVSFIGAIGERDKHSKLQLTSICIASMFAFLASAKLL